MLYSSRLRRRPPGPRRRPRPRGDHQPETETNPEAIVQIIAQSDGPPGAGYVADREHPHQPAAVAALITVDPSTIDPQQENSLDIFGRNLSQDTIVQVGTVGLRVADAPDAWHLMVVVPARALTDGTYDIGLTNADGQFDDAMGALTAAHPSTAPVFLFWIGGALVGGFVLFRVLRWLLIPSTS